MTTTATAWYIVPSDKVWARWANVLHWPYTIWHLSYVVIGTALADQLNWALLGWTVLAFFLGVGVAAHCYDLLKGDPLRLGIKPLYLGIIGGIALTGAVVIGLVQISLGNVSVWLLMAVTIGILLVLGYNLEWPELHGDWQFAASWAVFPFLVGYLAQGLNFDPVLIPIGVLAFATATTQRILSTRVRFLRRHTDEPYLAERWGEPVLVDNGDYGGGKAWLLAPNEKALAWLSAAMVLFAAAGLVSKI